MESEAEKVPRIIYQFWTGSNPITPNRLSGVRSMRNAGVESVLLYGPDIERRVLPDFPLHPAYGYLSETHRSDYLRCYFMHHFGGGYADIKTYSADNNWAECFDFINSRPEVDVVGQREHADGVVWREYRDPDVLSRLVANGYFIVRPRSRFSSEWWRRVNAVLDERLDELRRHPASSFRDCRGRNGSLYPLRWAEIQGEVFHRLCFDMRDTPAVCGMLRTGRTSDPYI